VVLILFNYDFSALIGQWKRTLYVANDIVSACILGSLAKYAYI